VIRVGADADALLLALLNNRRVAACTLHRSPLRHRRETIDLEAATALGW
jgi:hypothetical protein